MSTSASSAAHRRDSKPQGHCRIRDFDTLPADESRGSLFLLTKSKTPPCPVLRKQSADVLKGGRGRFKPAVT